MIPHIPWYITLIVLATVIAIAAATWMVLRAGARVSLSAKQQRTVLTGIGVFLAAWLGSLLLLAPAPSILQGQSPYFVNPLIPIFAIGPMALVLLALAFSPGLRATLKAAPLPGLVSLQTWRVIGVIFLVLQAMNQLPAHFAQPAAWGDIVIGLTAPLVALALIRRVRGSTALIYAWSIFGLADLAVAVGMGTGILPQLVLPEVTGRIPSAGTMGVFPMILVPGFGVPIAIMLHILTLARLRATRPDRGRQLAEAGR